MRAKQRIQTLGEIHWHAQRRKWKAFKVQKTMVITSASSAALNELAHLINLELTSLNQVFSSIKIEYDRGAKAHGSGTRIALEIVAIYDSADPNPEAIIDNMVSSLSDADEINIAFSVTDNSKENERTDGPSPK